MLDNLQVNRIHPKYQYQETKNHCKIKKTEDRAICEPWLDLQLGGVQKQTWETFLGQLDKSEYKLLHNINELTSHFLSVMMAL